MNTVLQNIEYWIFFITFTIGVMLILKLHRIHVFRSDFQWMCGVGLFGPIVLSPYLTSVPPYVSQSVYDFLQSFSILMEAKPWYQFSRFFHLEMYETVYTERPLSTPLIFKYFATAVELKKIPGVMTQMRDHFHCLLGARGNNFEQFL